MSFALNLDIDLSRFPPFPEKYQPLLKQYLSGQRVVPPSLRDDASLMPHISAFTRTVLIAASAVPYGETVTYSELARSLGRPSAVRAVASALGRNELPILIPCHRIVAAHGIGGYTPGIDLKIKLLDFERQVLDSMNRIE